MQEINEDTPTPSQSCLGEYLRIFASTSDDHRDITEFLKEKKVNSSLIFIRSTSDFKSRHKGLPISTDICDIQKDLTERGFLVNKVTQLTKTKFKLPIFMVELQKSPDSPDIFKLDRCCYLTVKIDTFNRRPGPRSAITAIFLTTPPKIVLLKPDALNAVNRIKRATAQSKKRSKTQSALTAKKLDTWPTRTAV
ncbi:PRE_C2HC domain-containing protein [Trichonephila clavipes]|nr:PRE_C2HC domain-containing protein [Trichonephila clavipes]